MAEVKHSHSLGTCECMCGTKSIPIAWTCGQGLVNDVPLSHGPQGTYVLYSLSLYNTKSFRDNLSFIGLF